MTAEPAPARTPFSITRALPPRLRWLAPVIDGALGLRRLNRTYARVPAGLSPHAFAGCTLDQVGVSVGMEAEALMRLPERGPCIVVANHPHGALDGVALIELLMRRRPDLRVMANHLLGGFVELAPLFIGVDPFGGRAALRHNIAATRRALGWLRAGGCLLLFPGGEVSSFDPATRVVRDPPWDSGVGWLAQKSAAPVLPLFIEGRNSLLFQALGLLHPRLRTALLVREMLNRRGHHIEVRAGRLLEADTLALLGDRARIAPFLQVTTELLCARRRYHRPWRLQRARAQRVPEVAVAAPGDPARLAAEVAALPAQQCLATSGNRTVWIAQAAQVPLLLQEIGRLRELSFRQVGEGTGRAVDIDLYDSYYRHLFVWDGEALAVVGGYRLGEADRILARYGARGLYVTSLFRLAPALEAELGAALEVGRSFVSPAYQRDYASLMLLWKGISAFVARHPRYRILFGPVSISNDYHPVSQQLIVRFLQSTSMEPERASLVRPRKPFKARGTQARLVDLDVSDMRIISALLGIVEDGEAGVPVLLRQYLKLNGRILGFNVDPAFNNVLDCLLWVDLVKADPVLLGKFMGQDELARFRALHGDGAAAASRA